MREEAFSGVARRSLLALCVPIALGAALLMSPLETSASSRAIVSFKLELHGPRGPMYAMGHADSAQSLTSKDPCRAGPDSAWQMATSTHGPVFTAGCGSWVRPTADELKSANGATAMLVSLHNLIGIFERDNPHGLKASDPTATIWADAGQGLSSGRYDASRPGYIQIKRAAPSQGGRGFGGTMRWFLGPNYFSRGMEPATPWGASWYYRYNAMRTLTNHRNPLTRNDRGNHFTDPQTLGQRQTHGSTQYADHPGGAIIFRNLGFATLAPWTTGSVMLDPDLFCHEDLPHNFTPMGACPATLNGYDNRSRTEAGLRGVLSLVQPWLYHSYPEAAYAEANTTKHYGFVNEVKFYYGPDTPKHLSSVPEPGATALLGLGVLGTLALNGLRRRQRVLRRYNESL